MSFFSIKYNSNYVSKTYITFQEKMWTEFVRAYIQIQKKSFLLNNLKSPEKCLFEKDNNISGLFVNKSLDKIKKQFLKNNFIIEHHSTDFFSRWPNVARNH